MALLQGRTRAEMESLLVAMAVMAVAQANPEAKRLYDDLLSNYNRLIRPVGNNSDRLTVKMGLKLSQLIDVVSPKFHFLTFYTLHMFQCRINKERLHHT